jgi:hypothetical protein
MPKDKTDAPKDLHDLLRGALKGFGRIDFSNGVAVDMAAREIERELKKYGYVK